MHTTATRPRPESPELEAARALGHEARRRGAEALFPEVFRDDLPESCRHLLIEGKISGCFLDVAMPNGETWRYRHGLDAADGRVLLVHIETSRPCVARIFNPTAEGIHPFAGEALRFGVEGGGK